MTQSDLWPGAGLLHTVAQSGNKRRGHHAVFYQHGGPVRLSLHDLDLLAARLAAEMRAAGLRPGQHVGVVARNGLAWTLVDLACVKAGFVTAGFEFGKMRLDADQVRRFELAAVYADGPLPELPAIDLKPLVSKVIAEGVDAVPPTALDQLTPDFGPRDIVAIKFTSGSTGEPKGLGATAGSIASSLAGVQAMFRHGDGDNLLVFLPQSLLQQRYWVYSAFIYGHDVTVAAYEFALEAAQCEAPTVIMGVPGFFDGLRRQVERAHPEVDRDLALRRTQLEAMLGERIRYLWTGSAPAAADTLTFFDDAGLPLFEGYGMNETCIVTKNHPGAHRRGSVGQVLPGKYVRIDDDGVLIVGSEYPVNTAYRYCQPGDSERMFRENGEVYTGDLARLDEDGYLYILGRADDVVVLANGKNIHTRRIEEQVRAHRAVGDCVVFGAGKPYLVAVLSPAEPGVDMGGVAEHIRALNAELKPDERIVRTYVAPQRFSVESGLLTSQFKPRRKEIYRTYSREIEQLYG